MYITPRQKKQILIRTLILLIGLPLTVLAGYFAINFISNAGGDYEPMEVVVSNHTGNSVSISWVTGKATTGQVKVKKGETEVSFTDTRGNKSSNVHYIEITDLSPSTEYEFTILSGGKVYAISEGKTLKIKTLAQTADFPIPDPIFGSGVGIEALIYLFPVDKEEVSVISTIASTTGTWYMDLSTFRNSEGNILSEIPATEKLRLVVRTSGGVGKVEGTRSELFGTDGEFTATVTLDPTASLLTSLDNRVDTFAGVTPTDPDPIDPDPIDPDPVDPDPVVPDPIVPDPVVPDPVVPDPVDPDPVETPFVRQFRIIEQVAWTPLTTNTTSQPQNVVVEADTGIESVQKVALSDVAFTVIWLTDEKVEGSVSYGIDPTALSSKAIDSRDSIITKGKYHTHMVKITNLQPKTKYYFKVNSGTEIFGSNGKVTTSIPYDITTFDTLSSPPPFASLNGKLSANLDALDTIVLVKINDKDIKDSQGSSWTTAVLPEINKTWTASYGDQRNLSGLEYFAYTDADELEISVIAYANSDPVKLLIKNKATTEIILDGEVSTTTTSGTATKVAPLTSANFKLSLLNLSSIGFAMIYGGYRMYKSQPSAI